VLLLSVALDISLRDTSIWTKRNRA